MFATCSVLRAENDGVITQFIAQQDNASVEPLSHSMGKTTDVGLQFVPSVDGSNGLYYALLKKV